MYNVYTVYNSTMYNVYTVYNSTMYNVYTVYNSTMYNVYTVYNSIMYQITNATTYIQSTCVLVTITANVPRTTKSTNHYIIRRKDTGEKYIMLY